MKKIEEQKRWDNFKEKDAKEYREGEMKKHVGKNEEDDVKNKQEERQN